MMSFIQNRLLTNPSAVTGLRRSSTIKIPPRIERGPTDILKALSSTIKPDPAALPYKTPDGGIFNPTSPYLKRITAFSMESGRKAARWVVEENPRVFQNEISDPLIKAFTVQQKLDENSEVSEEDLLMYIGESNVGFAMKTYNLLKEKNIDVAESTKQLLLELVCFYNSTDKPDETLLETQYYRSREEKLYNTWIKDGFAETLFREMEKNSKTYSALILGMLKHGNASDGLEMYEEAASKGCQFPVEVYNHLLAHVSLSFGDEERYNYILETFKKMKDNQVPPNLGTLNATLSTIANMRTWHRSRQFAMDVVQEFRNIGVRPSLGTYYHLLEIFFNRRNDAGMFSEMMDEIDPFNHSLRHPHDLRFFTKAMTVCAHNLKDPSMADRVHRLLCSGNNRSFLCGNLSEHFYYRSYLIARFRSEDMEEAMKLFFDIVPTVHSVDTSTMVLLLSRLEEKQAYKFYPAMWETAVELNVHQYAKTIEIVMRGLVHVLTEKRSDIDVERIRTMAEELWKHSRVDKTINMLEVPFYSDALIVFSHLGDFEKSTKIFIESTIISYCELSYEALSCYLTECIAQSDHNNAAKCIEMAYKCDYEIVELVARVKEHPQLVSKFTASQKKWLSKTRDKSSSEKKQESHTSEDSSDTD